MKPGLPLLLKFEALFEYLSIPRQSLNQDIILPIGPFVHRQFQTVFASRQHWIVALVNPTADCIHHFNT